MYTPEELRSMALWDAWCDAMPLTHQERMDATRRDRYASGAHTPKKQTSKHDQEYLRQRNREYVARYRAAHKDRIQQYEAAHAAEKAERNRDYYRFNTKAKGVN